MALALGHPEEAALHQAIGDMQVLLGDYRGALKSYETAAALTEASNLSMLEYKLGGVYSRLSQWELAESHFTAALNTQEEESPAGERARILAELSLVAHHRGDFERAQELAGQSLALAESAGDTLALAQAHNILGMLASDTGDFALARQHLERSLSLSTISSKADDPTPRIAALNNLALVYKASGDWEHALELTKSALALCVHVGDRHREAALHSNLADLLYALGHAEEAMSHLKQSASIFSEIGGEPGTLQPEIWKLVAW
jgi:tetratricopeptide (TPR) repeat protein